MQGCPSIVGLKIWTVLGNRLVIGFEDLLLFAGGERSIAEVLVTRQILFERTLGLDSLMVYVSLRNSLAVLRDNGRHDRNLVKRSPPRHCAVRKAIFQKADDFVSHLAASDQ